MDAEKLTLDDQLCFALYAATNAVTQAYRPQLRAVGLTYPQYLVLLVLWQHGASTRDHLTHRLSLEPDVIASTVERLERGGLIRRHQDEVDHQVQLMALTDAGAALERVVARIQHDVSCQTGLTQDAADALRESLLALAARMQI
ncbi:MarR family winged helix-turn-helix transcriptional regulator [Puniceibacterium sp. IMCC21224]|uniref:MarR family winged helix-turn-helix transcriptional regulator n=1 Tax=Puniceibacterium sp. IMCC21224 TaxID=1618204 RepID=UPI00064DBE95|nr:MarR family winged helix-turn-helix transcriptional regulator [Puniceibacterium sp. IMCC21224]KMK68649.1 transcriptional regulator [Puniceibacterium sp. IMCC21224]